MEKEPSRCKRGGLVSVWVRSSLGKSRKDLQQCEIEEEGGMDIAAQWGR